MTTCETPIYRILSVDGGGIKGLVPLTILDALERATNKSIPEMFNLVVGASIGSFVVAGLTTPFQGGAPRRSGAVRDLFYDMADEMFPDVLHGGAENLGDAAKFAKSLNHILYGDGRGLRNFAKALVGETTTLDQCIIPTVITAYDIISGRPFPFRSWNPKIANKASIVTALMSSGACPVYFPTVTVDNSSLLEEKFDEDRMDQQSCLIDGGALGISPALFGLLEMRDQLQNPAAQIKVVSIGTGAKPKAPPLIDPRSVAKRGISWTFPIVTVLLDALGEVEDKALVSLLGPNFNRIQTDLWQASRDIDRVGDDHSKSNCDALIEDAKGRLEEKDFADLCEFFRTTTKPTMQMQVLSYGEP